MRKPVFNPEINFGHILVSLSFIGPAVIFGINFASDFKVMKHDVANHSKIIDRLSETQELGMRNQAVLVQQFNDHVNTHKP